MPAYIINHPYKPTYLALRACLSAYSFIDFHAQMHLFVRYFVLVSSGLCTWTPTHAQENMQSVCRYIHVLGQSCFRRLDTHASSSPDKAAFVVAIAT